MARIVVIDDMDDMRMLYDDLLTSWGHEVVVFDDGAPALSTVDFSDVDLVLTDLQMPTSGQLVIRTIRAWGHDVPIVVVSGTVGPADFDGLKRVGAQEVMSKPPDFRALRQTIEDLVAQKGIPRQEEETC